MNTIPQQVYLVRILMREARRLARGREGLVIPMCAVIMRRLGIRFRL